MMTIILVGVLSLVVGFVVAFFIYRSNLTNLQMMFKGISSDVLKQSREEFIKQAEPTILQSVKPLQDALKRYEDAVRLIENKREEAYGGLNSLLKLLQGGQAELTRETGSLVSALKSSQARGRWGEVTLRRVVEIAGMSKFCDFDEQATVGTEDGRLRPDLVVHLPNNRKVIVDAKAPLSDYMNAVEAKDESSRAMHLLGHAKKVREHMRKLGAKSYWEKFGSTPDFVVLFLPGEAFFSAALDKDKTLIEDGMGMSVRVILATPTTLIVLLRSVLMGWQQEQLAENSQKISDAGKDLFERCENFAEHFSKIGQGLDRACKSFNQAVGSWETRVIPGARRLKELGATKNPDVDLPVVGQVETVPLQKNFQSSFCNPES